MSAGPAGDTACRQARGPRRAQEPGVAGVAVSDGEIGDEPGHAGVENGEVLSARLVAEGASEPTFAQAARAVRSKVWRSAIQSQAASLRKSARLSPGEASRVTMFTRTRSYGGYVGYAQIGNERPVGQRRTVSQSKTRMKWRGYAGYGGCAVLANRVGTVTRGAHQQFNQV